jgi:hypothetical protein
MRLIAASVEKLCWTARSSGGDGLYVGIVRRWVAFAGRALGRVDVVGKGVAGSGEPVQLIVQSP